MNNSLAVGLMLCGLTSGIGCTAKNYVRTEQVPLVSKINDLAERTTRSDSEIDRLDARASHIIQNVDGSAQSSAEALGRAQRAERLALTAEVKATYLVQEAVTLDSYSVVAHASVSFPPSDAHLTAEAKKTLDQIGGRLLSSSRYIVVVQGRTDSRGSDEYNFSLSKRRAREVLRYLVVRYNVPSYRIHAVGLGNKRPLAANNSRSGRRQNRSAEVDILSNTEEKHLLEPRESDVDDEEVVQLSPLESSRR